ncbi:MAG: DUF2092 domain-containing protein [Planctomycetota bacterium]
MKNPIAKLAIAAAVVAAVVIGISLFHSSGSGVIWAEVLEKTEQIPAVVYDITAYDMTAETDEPDGKLVRAAKTYVAGDYGARADTFRDGKLVAINYRLPRKNVAYEIRVDRQQYWRLDVSYEAALGDDSDDPRTWLKMILSGGGYAELGRTTIDGVVVEGIEGHQLEDSGEDCVMRIWVDVETNLPVRIEVEVKGMKGDRMRQSKFVMENFDWNAQLDESFFEPNIPDDYTQVENPRAARARQEDRETQPATAQVLTDEERAALPKIKQTVRLYLQACSDRNWDEILKHAPGLAKLSVEQREAVDDQCGGLEIVQMGEPFKREESDIWRVPCRITWKALGTGNNEIRVRYDETLGRFVIAGGP